jgi:hypothetical protein
MRRITLLLVIPVIFMVGNCDTFESSPKSENAITREPPSPTPIPMEEDDSYYLQGIEYFKTKEYDAALETFSKVIEIDENYSFAYIMRGQIYYLVQDDCIKAIPEFTKAIELNEEQFDRYFNPLIPVKEEDGLYLKIVTKIDPALILSIYWRGICYENLEQNEQSITDFSRLIKIYWHDKSLPDDERLKVERKVYTKTFYARSRVNFAMGNYDAAIEDLSAILEIDPNDESAISSIKRLKMLGFADNIDIQDNSHKSTYFIPSNDGEPVIIHPESTSVWITIIANRSTLSNEVQITWTLLTGEIETDTWRVPKDAVKFELFENVSEIKIESLSGMQTLEVEWE